MKPVRPGERGGRYHPFTDQDLEAIVENKGIATKLTNSKRTGFNPIFIAKHNNPW